VVVGPLDVVEHVDFTELVISRLERLAVGSKASIPSSRIWSRYVPLATPNVESVEPPRLRSVVPDGRRGATERALDV